MKKKALIAMSGGVDSSVAAFLMKQAGYECVGATMRLWSGSSDSDVNDAESVAKKLDMLFYAFDLQDEFEKCVIGNFISEYENGRTPNPCIQCNKYLKFGKLIEKAQELGCDTIATGHYAEVIFDETTGEYMLKKGADLSKDQSYVLYPLTQNELAKTVFPLGKYTKAQIREIAEENGFVNSRKKESQDICFVPDGDYASFIESRMSEPCRKGKFVLQNGEVLGEHGGIIRYTIGQRKGLGISYSVPLFVCDKNPKTNEVVLTTGDALFTREVFAKDANIISPKGLEKGQRVFARTRYNMKEQPAVAELISDDTIRLVFDEPQRAAAPGQSLVLYDGDFVIGGGIITKQENIK